MVCERHFMEGFEWAEIRRPQKVQRHEQGTTGAWF